MIYSNNVCVHFLSAVCALPSGSVRVQSSQNRHCWSLAVSPRSGASTLTSECSLQHSLAIIFTELFNTLFRCSLHLLSLGTLGSALTSSLNYVFSCNLSEWLFLLQQQHSWKHVRYECHNIQKRTGSLQYSNCALGIWRMFRCENTPTGVYRLLIWLTNFWFHY